MSSICSRIEAQLPAALVGELDEASRAEVSAHAEHCRACAEAYAFQAELHAAIARSRGSAPPVLYFDGVLEEIHRRMPPQAPARARQARRMSRETLASGTMAVLALVWLGSVLDLGLGRSAGESARRTAPQSTARVQERVTAAASKVAAPLVLAEGIGFVTADSPLLRLPPGFLKDLGLTTVRTALAQALPSGGPVR